MKVRHFKPSWRELATPSATAATAVTRLMSRTRAGNVADAAESGQKTMTMMATAQFVKAKAKFMYSNALGDAMRMATTKS